MALPADDLRPLILRIQQEDESAWAEFVECFAPLLLQVARVIENDRDAASDAFVFICQRLRERRGARLGAYDFDYPGTFETWLRAVALNLARDARRHRRGRFRSFTMVKRFPPLEQQVFRLRYELGLTFDQILMSLRPEFPGLTETRLVEADTLISSRVSAQQRWTLLTRRPHIEALEDDEPGPQGFPALSATPVDPEWLAIARQSRERLTAALARQTEEDRLFVRFHFERGLTLSALATMFGLSNPQAAHRRLRAILEQLRQILEGSCDDSDARP